MGNIRFGRSDTWEVLGQPNSPAVIFVSVPALTTYAPVVTDPPPPHRVVSSTTVTDGNRIEIDTEEFNPVFYDKNSMMGVHVQIGLEDDPPAILVRVLQYTGPPDMSGPATRPDPITRTGFPIRRLLPEIRSCVRSQA